MHSLLPLRVVFFFVAGILIAIPHAFAADKADRILENILLYQRERGGWPKNYDRDAKLSGEQKRTIAQQKSRSDAMIDNGATHTEIRLLAKGFGRIKDTRFKNTALRGISYLLKAQYKNGGWPQRFPRSSGYARHITFNDNAMIGVMSLLKDIAGGKPEFAFVADRMRAQCEAAVKRGIECILKCQVIVDGKPTVWCAQHDHVTFEPRKARSYELASLSGSESVGVVRFLMELEKPDKRIIHAIEGAVGWFKRSKLKGIKVVRVKDKETPRGYDKVVVKDPDAPPLWARFYDIKTNRPIFCSRDGIPRRTLAEISHERRTGYSWLGQYARDLLAKDLPRWRKKLTR